MNSDIDHALESCTTRGIPLADLPPRRYDELLRMLRRRARLMLTNRTLPRDVRLLTTIAERYGVHEGELLEPWVAEHRRIRRTLHLAAALFALVWLWPGFAHAATESLSERMNISSHGRDLVIDDDLSVTLALLNNGEEVSGNGYARQTVTGSAPLDTGVVWRSTLAPATFTASGGTITFDQWQIRSGSAVLDTSEVEEHTVTTGNSAALTIRITSRSVNPTMPVPAWFRGQSKDSTVNLIQYGASTERTDNDVPLNECMADVQSGALKLKPFLPSGRWKISDDWTIPQMAGPTMEFVGATTGANGEDFWTGATAGQQSIIVLNDPDASVVIDTSGMRGIGGLTVYGAYGATQGAMLAVADRADVGIHVVGNPEGGGGRISTGGHDLDAVTVVACDDGIVFGQDYDNDHATDNHIGRFAAHYCERAWVQKNRQSVLTYIDGGYAGNCGDVFVSEGGGNLEVSHFNLAPSITGSVLSIGEYEYGVGYFKFKDLRGDGEGVTPAEYLLLEARNENVYSHAVISYEGLNMSTTLDFTPWFKTRGGWSIHLRDCTGLRPEMFQNILTGATSDTSQPTNIYLSNCSWINGATMPLASGNNTFVKQDDPATAGTNEASLGKVYVRWDNNWREDGSSGAHPTSGEATYIGASQSAFRAY